MQYLAIDTETTGLNVWKGDRPFAFSFCDDEENQHYFRWEVDPFTRKVTPDSKSFKKIQRLLHTDVPKIFHNAMFDLRMLESSGFTINGPIHDTIWMMHAARGGDEPTFALKPLAHKYLDYPTEDLKELKDSVRRARNAGRKKGWNVAKDVEADYWMGDRALCKQYALLDAERTMGLFLLAQENMDENGWKIYEQERELFPILKAMEERGVRVFEEDVKRLGKFYKKYQLKQKVVIRKMGYKDFNINSAPQLQKILFKDRGHTPVKYTAGGNPSADGDVLSELAPKDPFAKAVLEHNAAGHTLSNYITAYQEQSVVENGIWVLHPNFRQVGTKTGRMSCGKPNVMNVVSETTGRRKADITGKAREALGPRDGYIWYLPDYSQIEVWVFSFLAEEEKMCQALLDGHDFHGKNAENVWGMEKDYEKNMSYYRKRSKLIMFCKFYGGGVKKVAQLIECSVREAEKFVDAFDAALPGVQRFMKQMMRRAERDGKIVNPFGRTYIIPPDFAYRATNYIVQGTSADIFKRAIIRVGNLFLQKEYRGCCPLIPVHDELICEIPLRLHSKPLMRAIVHEMQKDSKVVNVPVPLPVGMKVAKHRWSKTEEIEL